MIYIKITSKVHIKTTTNKVCFIYKLIHIKIFLQLLTYLISKKFSLADAFSIFSNTQIF